jgi:hypothetical protein
MGRGKLVMVWQFSCDIRSYGTAMTIDAELRSSMVPVAFFVAENVCMGAFCPSAATKPVRSTTETT